MNVSEVYDSYMLLWMDNVSYTTVNLPLALISMSINVFFVFCVLTTRKGQDRFKQPLKVLLVTLVCSNTFSQMLLLFTILQNYFIYSLDFYDMTDFILIYAFGTCMSSSLYLSIFYYSQIVPSKHKFFMWMKRNIKTIIYCLLFFDQVHLLSIFVSKTFYAFFCSGYTAVHYSYNSNGTFENFTDIICDDIPELWDMYLVMELLKMAVVVITMAVMTVTSFVTGRYLYGHMKKMAASWSSFSSPRLKSQLIVTIVGSFQGFLYLLCSLWYFMDSVIWLFTKINIDSFILRTVFSLYCTGTSLNLLGFGQSVCRQKATEFWKKVRQTFGKDLENVNINVVND